MKYINTIVFLAIEAMNIYRITVEEIWDIDDLNHVSYIISEYDNLSTIERRHTDLMIQYSDLLRRLINIQNQSTIDTQQYDTIPARVINNNISYGKNYLTLNKGSDSGIENDMAVCTSEGFVGHIVNVSKHYSVVMSLLHDRQYISARLVNADTVGFIKWFGRDHQHVNMLYVPQHINVHIGDRVVTSEYNSILPKDIQIGIVTDVNDHDTLHNITVKVSNDFSFITDVFVIKNKTLNEQKDIEQQTVNQYA